ncbi:zinc finger MIZ domain-containing protein 2 [Cladorrhinum samala]|uniref:Zinc finger MIZ domain-containing protein 2 n=1 Tax=Cladorrhinum samala TaxID=585594 RepID=A0AAV9H9S5_9PEZI|nr:zinc finger MIZ domain-containing protein 2 [Cladorrhinum samala]
MPAHNPTTASNKGHPPAGPSAADPGQIASTNATVNAFLKGARKPSWLTAGGSTPGASSLTSKTKPHSPLPVPVVLPSPAPSDEPSPALSSSLDSPNIHLNIPPAALPDAVNMGPSTSRASSTLPVTDARFVHEPVLRDPTSTGQGSLGPGAGGKHPAAEPAAPQHVVPANSGTSYGAAPMETRSSRSGSITGHESNQGLVIGAPPTAKRRRLEPAPNLSMSSLKPIILEHIQRTGGEAGLRVDVDKPRMQLLMAACEQGDYFFVALHQLFAIWSEMSQEAYRILQLPADIVDQAFSTMEQLLKKNQSVSPEHRRFFANFPDNWAGQQQQSQGFLSRAKLVAQFLEKMVKEYETLTRDTANRRYPYLVEELRDQLGCHSPVLQGIFFTANRRRLGVMDGPLGNQIEQAFKADQKQQLERGNGMAREAFKQQLIQNYKDYVEAATKGRHHGASIQGPTDAQAQMKFGAPPVPSPVVHPSQLQFASPTLPQQQSPFVPIMPAAGSVDLTAAGHLQMRYQPPPSPSSAGFNSLASAIGVPPASPYQTPVQYFHPQQQQFQQAMLARSPSGMLTSPRFHYSPAYSSAPTAPTLQPQPAGGKGQLAQAAAGLNGTRLNRHAPHAPQVAMQRMQQAATQRTGAAQLRDRIIPPKDVVIARPDWPYDPTDRKSIMNSLHQAHVRSPKRILKNGGAERVYQAVKSLPVSPTLLASKNELYVFHFDVTEEQLRLAGRRFNPSGSLISVVEHFNGMLRWRARCCIPKTRNQIPSEQEWVTLDVSWPANIFMSLNRKPLDIRKQPHNGKDLAVELTDHLIIGTNVLRVGYPQKAGVAVDSRRFLSVELLETVSHSDILNSIWENGVISEDVTMQIIKKRLAPPDDDDGLVIEASDISIDLADPFSSVLFEVPARGADCTHLECFDLETWLNTRPSKPKIKCHHTQVECDCPNTPEPSSPDKWRCPICFKDARPYSLRIDEFLLKVRSQLKEQGKLNTKCLHVKADGTWFVVVEEDDDEDSDGETSPAGGPTGVSLPKKKAPAAPVAARRQEVEVIEID